MELRCIEALEKEGYFAIRSGGSHSPADVIAVDLNGVRLIQVKRCKTKYNTNYLYQDPNVVKLMALRVPVNCKKEIWTWIDRKGWKVNDLGNMDR